MDNTSETVDNLGKTPETVPDTPTAPISPNVSDPSDNVPAMTTGLVETHLMKSGEVCNLLHIGRTTLWEWRRDGRITGIQHTDGGPWYYPADQDVITAALRAVGSIR